MQVKEAVKEVDRIVKEAELMYNTADEGTVQAVNIDFPSGVKKVVFGSLDPDNANRYYITMDWGENRSFHSKNVKFSQSAIYGGAKSITLRLVNDGGKYVKIEVS